MSTVARQIRLVLDFDGTLTKKDTLHLVAKAGYDRQKSLRRQPPPIPWTDIVGAYMSNYNLYESEYRPGKQLRRTLLEEVTWLNSLKTVENASIHRVYNAGIFENVRKEDMSQAANEAVRNGEIQLRSGWLELLQTVLEMNETRSSTPHRIKTLQVLSVNWSRWYIWSTILAAAQATKLRTILDFLTDREHSIDVYANEIPAITDESTSQIGQLLPGGRSTEMRTSGDKLDTMLINCPMPVSDDSSPLCIYIGDSITDLECLIAAHVGICMRETPMGSGQQELSDCCERIGICVKHISCCNAIADSEGGDSTKTTGTTLLWATDFEEVIKWLVSTSASPSLSSD